MVGAVGDGGVSVRPGMLGWLEQKKISPTVDAALPLERAGEALEKLERRDVKGKLVLVP